MHKVEGGDGVDSGWARSRSRPSNLSQDQGLACIGASCPYLSSFSSLDTLSLAFKLRKDKMHLILWVKEANLGEIPFHKRQIKKCSLCHMPQCTHK